MRSRFPAGIELELRPSRRLYALTMGMHMLALVALALAALPFGIQIGLAGGVLFSAGLAGWQAYRQPRDRQSTRLRLGADGQLAVEVTGVWQAYRVDGSTRVTGVLVYLCLVPGVPGAKRQRYWVDSSALPAEAFRQLRVWLLRWGSPSAGSATGTPALKKEARGHGAARHG